MKRRKFFGVLPGIFLGNSLLAQSGQNSDLRRVWTYHGLEKKLEEIDWPDIKYGMLITFEDDPTIFVAVTTSYKDEIGIYRVGIEVWNPKEPFSSVRKHWITEYMSAKKTGSN